MFESFKLSIHRNDMKELKFHFSSHNFHTSLQKLRLLDINDTELDPSGTLESLINHGIIDLNERQLKMSYS